MQDLNEIIKGVRDGLAWPVKHEEHDQPDLIITSDPYARTHTVSFPRVRRSEVRTIEYLHELAHAHLAEKVHHLLSTAYFRHGTPDEQIYDFIWPQRTAADWYADALLMKWCRKEGTAEILEHLQYVLRPINLAPEEMKFITFGGGLICAQAAYWRLRSFTIPSMYRPVARILRDFDPYDVTLLSMETLVNTLAGLVTNRRIRLTSDDETDVGIWEIIEKSK